MNAVFGKVVHTPLLRSLYVSNTFKAVLRDPYSDYDHSQPWGVPHCAHYF